MDNLTHGLVGAVMGQAGLKRKTGLAMPALVLGANLPDLDAISYFLDNMQHLAVRRGITHGPIAWLVLPPILAGLLYGFDRWQTRRGKRPEGRVPVSFKWLCILSFLACLTHPALDWMNVYGIRLLEPFSSRWFYGDVLFIIDVCLWALLGFATWFSLRREKRGGEWRKPARTALAVMLAYIGVNYVISEADRALNTSFQETISSPRPIAFWERESIGVAGDGRFYQEGDLLGDLPLEACDLDAARAALPAVDNFLFWSRAPFIRIDDQGRYWLADARFASSGGGRFTVQVPASYCGTGE